MKTLTIVTNKLSLRGGAKRRRSNLCGKDCGSTTLTVPSLSRDFVAVLLAMTTLLITPHGFAEETQGTENPMPTKTCVKIETTLGVIEAELYPNEAPKTVKNFVDLSKKGFYDGLIFHRVIPDFKIGRASCRERVCQYV